MAWPGMTPCGVYEPRGKTDEFWAEFPCLRV